MKLRLLKDGVFGSTGAKNGNYYIGAATYQNRECLALIPGYSRDRILPDVHIEDGRFRSNTFNRLLIKLNSDRSFMINSQDILIFNKTTIN